MAAEEDLTTKQIARLAHVISTDRMETIALGYLGLEEEEVTSLKLEKKDQHEAFNRAVLKIWANKNSTPKQIKKLASKLYEAADEGGYVDPKKVETILGITKEEANALDSETEEDEFRLNTLLKHLKARASELKTEMAPWVKNLSVKMEDVKTRLDVIDKRKQVKWVTSDYTDIFEGTEPLAKRMHSALQIRRKVLVKGRIGQGKSTVAKKIVFDWAKGVFKSFPMVFFIDMKLAKPDDSIERIIVDQNGLDSDFTPEKIKEILGTFGGEILVVVDGLCDHTVKVNECVLHAIQKQNLEFNLVFTLTESNLTENIDNYFDTICQVQGFDNTDVKSFVAKLAESHREVVLKWIQSLPETLGDQDHRNPLLVLLLSYLASHDPSPDVGQNISMFTVHAKILLALLGTADIESQRNLVKTVGRIAFDNLQSGKVCTKAEISDHNILAKGLLTESKTSLVTFAHSSLQIFLASLYMVLALEGEGVTVESLLGTSCEKPVFMINSLFLYFCLSLLSENQLVELRTSTVHFELKKYILGRINTVQLDLQTIGTLYPALNIPEASKPNDRLSLQFLIELLTECTKVQDLILTPCPGLSVDKILSAMKEQCQTLRSIRLLDDDEEQIHVNITKEFCPEDLTVIIYNQSGKCVDDLLEFLQTIDRAPCIYFIGGSKSKPMIDLSIFPTNVGKLYLMSRKRGRNPYCDLTARKGIPQLQSLTHLSFPDSKFSVDAQVVEALSEAFTERKFPKLSHLRLEVSGLSGKFSKLLKSGCPTLRVLTFLDFFYVQSDEACWKQLLPQLESITVGNKSSKFEYSSESLRSLSRIEIDASTVSAFTKAMECKFPKLTHLDLFKIPFNNNDHIHELLNIRSLPSLTHLTITGEQGPETLVEKLSQNERVQNLRHFHVSGLPLRTVSYFFRNNTRFPILQSLAFSGCITYTQDLRILAQACSIGLLPKLEHLDLSKNDNIHDFQNLFDFDSKWGNLKSFNIERDRGSQSHLPFQDFQCLTNQVQSGGLRNLENLQVFVETEDFLRNNKSRWSCLKNLRIAATKLSMYKIILSCLTDSHDRECFPELKVITLKTNRERDATPRPCIAREKQRLRGKGISVYFITDTDMW